MYDKIKTDMIQAMKDHNKVRTDVIKMTKAAIDKEKIDKKIEITDEVVIDVLAKQVKLREDSVVEFDKANRSDLSDAVKLEIEILKEYLPEPLSDIEVDKIIDEAISELSATTIKDMGRVMKLVTPLVKGRTDMKEVSNKIKNKLS